MPSPILQGRRANTAPGPSASSHQRRARRGQSEDLISAIEAASGLKVEIISGAQEAGLAFQGVTTDPDLAKRRCCCWMSAAQHAIHSWPGRPQAFRAQFPARRSAVA